MTDPGIILRKLTSLRDHVDRLRRRREVDLATFRADLDRQDALAMSLLVAVQESVDIALHMASDEGWGVPASYGDSFALLERNGVLLPALAQQMAAMAALRNRLAHGYATVDAERLWNELPAGIAAFNAFVAAIAQHLDARA